VGRPPAALRRRTARTTSRTGPDGRAPARTLATRSLARGDPTGWFEELYRAAERGEAKVPWVDRRTNPLLAEWTARTRLRGRGKEALVIGCGLGDDAEFLAVRGFRTTAFDVAPTAIRGAKRRFPRSRVRYLVLDLDHAPGSWRRRFDLVLEAYTVQVLRGSVRRRAICRNASFVRPEGRLWMVARARRPTEGRGAMPWPLTRKELLAFASDGLTVTKVEELFDRETPPVRRWRAEFRRPDVRA